MARYIQEGGLKTKDQALASNPRSLIKYLILAPQTTSRSLGEEHRLRDSELSLCLQSYIEKSLVFQEP